MTHVTWLASPMSEAQVHVCLPVCGAPGECYHNTLDVLCFNYYSLSSVVSCAFSACIQSYGIILTPMLICAKFCFFCGLHWWGSRRWKIAYSITHSITHLIWCPGNRSACTSENSRICWVLLVGHVSVLYLRERRSSIRGRSEMRTWISLTIWS